MPKIRDYACPCGHRFEHTFMTAADETEKPACPACKRVVTDHDEVLGGTPFGTIVPMHRTSLRSKAGYVHTHGDRPAEKGSVSVPRTGEIK